MNDRKTTKTTEWIYQGVWKVLSDAFKVPQSPPTLPSSEGESVLSLHPSPQYLGYLKTYFWVGLIVFDVALLGLWIAVCVADPRIGILIALPVWLLAIVPDIVAYVAIHLRYDTLWYVISNRSLRCRRGIWVIAEHTITFENVQNVGVSRGPLEYLFGISTICVETAAAAAEGEHPNRFASGNQAILEGLANPKEILELIMTRVRNSRSSGLGDEIPADRPVTPRWSKEHLQLLREIRDAINAQADHRPDQRRI